MRFLSLILALGAIGWLFLRDADTGDTDKGGPGSAVPPEYQQTLEKARGVEDTMLDAAEQRLEAIDRAQP